MKRIVIPTDFSSNAGDALNYALHLTQNADTIIQIVHVINPNIQIADIHTGATNAILKQMIESAQERLDTVDAMAKIYCKENDDKNLEISSVLMFGNFSDQIKKAAIDFDADIIIMGTQGENHSFTEKVFGTVSSNVIKNSSVPVMLIPSGYKFKDIDNIIFATNLDHSDPYELYQATKLLSPNYGVIQCVHVVKINEDKNSEEIDKFSEYMIENSPSIQTRFFTEVSDDVEEVIQEYAENYDAELIIMHKKQKTILQRVFSPSYTKRMLWLINRPLMVLN